LFKALAIGCTINNRASIMKDSAGLIVREGEPTEAALKVLAEKLNHENEFMSFHKRT